MFDTTRHAARLLAASAAALLLASCGGSSTDTPEAAPLFQTTVVVGSSVVDTGNRCGVAADPLCFPTPPYAGRSTASNGSLYVQTVAARYGTPLVASSAGGFNYGTGGATTGTVPTDTVAQKIPNMNVQLEQFLQRVGYQANPQHLYIVDGAAFGNNVRRVLELLGANPALAATLPTQAVQAAAADIFGVVTRLYAAGARHVVVTNVSNVGAAPAIAGLGASAIQLAGGMSVGYNGALAAQVIPGLRGANPGLNIYYVDLAAVEAGLATNPNFTNLQAPCYPFFSAPAAPICANPGQYKWWDELHPSAAVHALIADRAIAAIGR
jgi:phospholipase/lecithinase/hemolysin